MIRVRFAPSPTGHLHIGGLRASLFNYYFAKKNNGKFVIRIEDTDVERNKQEYTTAILDAFAWCDIKSDEPILYQSQRNKIYEKYIDQLLQNNTAYYAEEYNEAGSLTRVIKCRVNKDNSHIRFNDIIRGEVAFPTSEIDDFIIVRSDGTPLYNLVVVIDDIEMNITHIIRGEEHLSNTPKQLILYEALLKNPPQFAHLPLILGPDRKKLSKRDAATSVMDYQKEGFLPEALCMYLMRLGWAYKDQEIFTYQELLTHFRLEDVHHGGAIFDRQKLLSMNNIYIKNTNLDILYKYIEQWDSFFHEIGTAEQNKKIITLYQSRATLLTDFKEAILRITMRPQWKQEDITVLEISQESLQQMITTIHQSLKHSHFAYDTFLKSSLLNSYEKPLLYKSLRYALIGAFESPSIVEIMEIIGKQEIEARLENFLFFIS
jgi:glutamyl-tRNA synthetase